MTASPSRPSRQGGTALEAQSPRPVHRRGTGNAHAPTADHGAAPPLTARMEVRLVGGEAGRALAAAQARALLAMLASAGETEVGQGKEVSP